ncbi:MAG: thiamine pyrophosphate-dependent enzyme [Dehalococcoidia bacterium]|nr:thiamine pyrophosphate-dependent enzyme [Dehalococcoidia bacterium]
MTATPSYRTALKPVWCPGCGIFGLLNALTRKALPNLGIPNHQALIVSGIGCSSRIPAYVDTYGFNSIHGRAVVIAQGAKLAKPDVTVVAIGGDGDFFSIGAGHLPHAVRRNLDITCIVVDNFIYALTKGQTSPTTPNWEGDGEEEDFFTAQVYPPVDPISNMLSYSLSAQASFIAQGISTDPNHLDLLIEAGIRHKGFSFINVLTPCVTYNPPEMFEAMKSRATYLKEGEMVELPASATDTPWRHDPTDINRAMRLAQAPILNKPYLGVFFKGKPAGMQDAPHNESVDRALAAAEMKADGVA